MQSEATTATESLSGDFPAAPNFTPRPRSSFAPSLAGNYLAEGAATAGLFTRQQVHALVTGHRYHVSENAAPHVHISVKQALGALQ